MSGWNTFWTKLKGLVEKVREPERGSLQPLELKRAILRDVEGDVVAIGDGKKVFPYTHLDVRVLVESERDEAALEAAFGDTAGLEAAVQGQLEGLGCSVPDLTVDMRLVGELDEEHRERRFAIFKTRRRDDPQPTSRPAIELTVEKGRCEQAVYRFDQDRIHIGRLREVLDEHGRLRRQNDVAFGDEDEDSRSVSREHARIQWRDGEPRLIDDRSGGGTQIYRSGQPIRVSSIGFHGVRLQDGDLLYLGRAALRFRLVGAAPSSTDDGAGEPAAVRPKSLPT